MKETIVTWNWGKNSRKLRELLVTGKMFAALAAGSMAMVMIVGVCSIFQQKAATSPVSSMKGLAANVSEGWFDHMLAMEITGANNGQPAPALSGKQVGSMFVRMVADVNPSDPRTLLAGEYPAMRADETVLLRPGSTADATIEPEDRQPAGTGDSGAAGDGENAAQGADDPAGAPITDSGRPEPDGDSSQTSGSPDAAVANNGRDIGSQTDKPDSGSEVRPTTAGRNVVFIYHSHSRESWFPEIKGGGNDPTSATINITLLGKRLAAKLKEQGIGALSSSKDYPSAIKNYNWALSYKYSKKTVTEALANNKDLKFLFDIHRDSLRRKNTTTTINGQSYAQLFFIIGHANPDWRQNEAFASEIHEALEKQYPGISRGIWGKSTANGNGEYNQSLAPDSVLIEVGGVDNTLEESYRTIDALAKVIANLYWKDEKVSAPIS